ncbi:hypothetical protein HDU93_008860 [Gonapodya sp. JEL0774]|nr:hypothetical protein HDU93_008860 [Gonapodya sp. JEL0774]
MPEKALKQMGLLGRVFGKRPPSPAPSISSPEFPSAGKLNDLEIIKLLGKGKEGRVFEATHRPTGIHVAVKEISKPRTLFGRPGDPLKEAEMRKSIQNEIDIMKDAAITMATLINAIGFLHKHGVVHRDIKSANVLFRTPSHTSDICLVDFGISRVVEPGQRLTEMTGTLAYIAPEILLQRGYGAGVDMWAAGVMTYELVSGYQPFHSIESQEDLFDRILRADFDFPTEWFGNTNPKTRYTAAQCLTHPWFLKFVPTDYLAILSEINDAAEQIKEGLESPHRIEYGRSGPDAQGQSAQAVSEGEGRVLDLMAELLDEEDGKGTYRRLRSAAVSAGDTAIAKAKFGGKMPGVLEVGDLLGGLDGKNLPNLHLKLTRTGGRRRHSVSIADVSRRLHVEHEQSPLDLAAAIPVAYFDIAPARSPDVHGRSTSPPSAVTTFVAASEPRVASSGSVTVEESLTLPAQEPKPEPETPFRRDLDHHVDIPANHQSGQNESSSEHFSHVASVQTPRPRRLSFDVALYEHRKEITADPLFFEDGKQETKDDVTEELVEHLADFARPQSRGGSPAISSTGAAPLVGLTWMAPETFVARTSTPPGRTVSPRVATPGHSKLFLQRRATPPNGAAEHAGSPSPGAHRGSPVPSPSWAYVGDGTETAKLMMADLVAREKSGELLGTEEEFEARVARVKERVMHMVQNATLEKS